MVTFALHPLSLRMSNTWSIEDVYQIQINVVAIFIMFFRAQISYLLSK